MRRLDALYPRYGFVSHVGYITPAHSLAVRTFGPRRCTAARSRPPATRRAWRSTLRSVGWAPPREPRRAPRPPPLPTARVPARRGERARRWVRARSGAAPRAHARRRGGEGEGGPPSAIRSRWSTRRRCAACTRPAGAWRARHPELAPLELAVEAVGVRGRRVERVPLS
jgi:hypothetical protein